MSDLGWPTTDDHHLDDDHLPTPFTAAEIRDATPPGHAIDLMRYSALDEAEGRDPVTRLRTTFEDVDADGATVHTVRVDEAGTPVAEVARGWSTWRELQAHGSFPSAVTTRARELIRSPLGQLECLRYTVQRGDDDDVYWFAQEFPGMPVRYGTERAGRFVTITTVTGVTG